MKKILIAILVLITSLFAVGCSAAVPSGDEKNTKEEIRTNKIAVLTDIHLPSDEEISTQEGFDFMEADEAKASNFAIAALQTTIDQIIARKDVTSVVVSGDMTISGLMSQHETAAKYLSKLKENGIDTYVINGNHDLGTYGNSATYLSDFIECYQDFGYDSAISIHQGSASYSADVSGYRMIAIDNNSYNIDASDENYRTYPDETIMTWLENELIRANSDGKKVFIMYHQPYQPQLLSLFHSGVNEECDTFGDLITKYGVKLCFCGHNHGNLITSYNTTYGEFCEVMTSSTVYTDPCYRILDLNGDAQTANIETVYVEKLDAKYVSEFCDDATRELVTTDYAAYTNDKAYYRMTRKLNGYIYSFCPQKLSSVRDVLIDVVSMPLYQTEEGESLEDYVMELGGNPLPQTDCVLVKDITYVYMPYLNSGDMFIDTDGPETELLEDLLYVALYLVQDKLNSELPDDSKIDLDMEKLFQTGKLEAIESGFINGLIMYIDLKDIVSTDLSMFNFTSLEAFAYFSSAIDTMILPEYKLGTLLKPYISSNDFDLKGIIEDVLFKGILNQLFVDDGLSDISVTLPF